jgi:hypothetical protein
MSSTTSTSHPASNHSYLKALTGLDVAEIRGNFSEPAVEVDGGLIQRLRPTDVETLAALCDNNYRQQQTSLKMFASNSERLVTEAVSRGAGDSFEACADL